MRSVAAALAATTALALLPGPSNAQIPFDLRGGLNLTRLVSDDDGEADRKRGLALGAAVTPLRFGPVSVVLEGYYRQKGGGFRALAEPGQPVPDALEIGLSYVEVPVLLRLTVPLGERAGLHFQGGPVFGWQIDCGVEIDAAAGGAVPECDDLLGGSAGETLRDYEQGVTGGAGLELLVLGGAGAVTFDAVVTRGLSRLSEGTAGRDIENRGLSLMLGYSFNPALALMR